MIEFTNHLGHKVEVDPFLLSRELTALVAAADDACGASSTEAPIENLRRARRAFMDVLARESCRFPSQHACWDDQDARADSEFCCPIHGQVQDTLERLGVDVL